MTTMAYTGQSTALREDFAYSARDQVTGQFRFSNLAGTTTVGYSTFSYDSVGRLTHLQHLNGSGSNIANFTNTYDLASRITSEVLNGGLPTTYSYDITNQLTDDTLVTYAYDPNGNRLTTGTFSYSTAGANQLASDGIWNYFYDQNANLIQKTNAHDETFVYGYDNRNRMISVTDTTSSGLQMQATYSYDALGQRIMKDVWTGGVATVTQMAYDDGRQIWVDMNGSSALQKYPHGKYPGVASTCVEWRHRGMAFFKIGCGQCGMWWITLAVTATNTYSGFGVIESQSSVTAGGLYLWAGYRFDVETSLFRPDQTWSRPYGAGIGRWWMIDPILFGAGDANPWRYVGNVPVRYVDPSGLGFWDWIARTIGVDNVVAADRVLGNSTTGWATQTSNASAGYADTLSMGTTCLIRSGLNYDDAVRYDSDAYTVGQVGGTVHGMLMMGSNVGTNVARQMGGARGGLVTGIKRFCWDNRRWNSVSRTWSGSPPTLRAAGQSLHHVLLPQRLGKLTIAGRRIVPQGLINAGFNYMPMSAWRNSVLLNKCAPFDLLNGHIDLAT